MSKPRYRVGTDGSTPRLISPAAVPVPAPSTPSSQYMRGGASPFFFNWNPALRDVKEDVRAAYVQAAARAIDSIHNSGWLSGAVDQSIASMIGTGLRLAAKPDHEALGWTKDAADKWARKVERRFEAWSGNKLECDAGGKQTLGQMQAAFVKSYYGPGEGLALLPKVTRPVSLSRTKIKLMPAHKLVQDSDETAGVFQGVQMVSWGLPVAYRVMMRIGRPWEEKVTIPARDGANRPQVVHVFEGEADQVRGLSPMAPALRVLRQFDQLSDNVLQNFLLRALFAATVQSETPTDAILQALQDKDEQGVGAASLDGFLGAKAGWYQSTRIDLGRGGRIAHLFPGEKLEFHSLDGTAASYEAFAKFLLREIARCLGMTFETLTGDYSGATYSSVRMATSEIWPIILRRRAAVPGAFCQTVYEAWLEEEIETGRVEFPGGVFGFMAHREAACRADWRGPAKPQADDLKTAKAHETYKRLGVITDEQICADLGQDWEDVYEQRAREAELRKKLNLPDGDTLQAAADEALVNKLVTEDA